MSNSNNKKDCTDPNCSTCLMGASKSYIKSPSITMHITSFNTYTLGLVFQLIGRKCIDKDYMLLERIKWTCPQFVYILEIQLMDEHPFNEVIRRNSADTTKEQFNKYYAANFSTQVSEILQKTFLKDIEKRIKKIQKTHKVAIQKINIILIQRCLESLNLLIGKYIDIIGINAQMN
jgi:hypothetical protein